MSKIARLYAPDISCQHCAMAIQRALRPLQGIAQLEVNVSEKIITLTLEDEEVLSKAKAILEEIGYPAQEK